MLWSSEMALVYKKRRDQSNWYRESVKKMTRFVQIIIRIKRPNILTWEKILLSRKNEVYCLSQEYEICKKLERDYVVA